MSAICHPLTRPKDIHGCCGKKGLKSELFAANIARSAHLTRAHGLRNGPFHPGSFGIDHSELGGQFTRADLLKSPIGLFIGLQDQHACGTVCALIMERTRLTNRDAGNRTRMTGFP